MKRARGHAGYTIIETMIFLAISGALIASATVLFDGRIQRAEFNQGVQQFDAHIRTTISEVAAGTYSDTNSFNCVAAGGSPRVTNSSSNGQGTRGDCIFVGKVMHFPVATAGPPACVADGDKVTADSECDIADTYTTVGLRAGGINVATAGVADSAPLLLNGVDVSGGGNPDKVDLTAHYPLINGLHITGVKLVGPDGTKTAISAFGLFQNSQGNYASGDNNLSSGSNNVQLIPIFASGAASTPDQIDALVANPGTYLTIVNPPGILICLAGGRSQVATIHLGTNTGNLATTVKIGEDACS